LSFKNFLVKIIEPYAKMHVRIKRGYIFYLTKEEIKKISHLEHGNFLIKIHLEQLKYKKPKHSFQECVNQEKTLSISIYIPIEIRYKNKIIFEKKYTLLGDIALLSKKGTFIVNGNTRIVVNQIVRSPGVYFQKDKNKKTITSTIIPNQGSWITIKLNL
jgi:DNA-directed RNA polymerase subunit beta